MVAVSLFKATDIISNKVAIQERLNTALSTPEQYELIVGRKGNSVENIKKRVQGAGLRLILNQGAII